jgi:hypothetical protein
MGCGQHHKDGFVNVDKYPPADVVCDLEKYYRGLDHKLIGIEWPWDTSSVDEVIFHHSLEHMGATVDGFLHIFKELYRVCVAGAVVKITVPHPRNDDFINDPTHVRIITPMILELFSKKNNKLWAEMGTPNTPLGLQLNVDFEIIKAEAALDARCLGLPEAALKDKMEHSLNVLKQYEIWLRVVK